MCGFLYLKNKFLRVSDAKNKEGAFEGSRIRESINVEQFDDQMNEVGRAACLSSKLFLETFWTIIRQKENYREILSDLSKRFKTMECYMSVNIHFVDSHLDYFPENFGPSVTSTRCTVTKIFPTR